MGLYKHRVVWAPTEIWPAFPLPEGWKLTSAVVDLSGKEIIPPLTPAKCIFHYWESCGEGCAGRMEMTLPSQDSLASVIFVGENVPDTTLLGTEARSPVPKGI